jgi:hypothetical protein
MVTRRTTGISRYVGQPLDIPVVFESDPMVPYGHTFGDILDVSMCWKRDPATDTDDQYLQKTLGGGGVTVINPAGPDLTMTFVMVLESADYTNVTVGRYHLVLAVQVAGGGPWIELDIPDDEVNVVSDGHRA